jgi:hypothetical protein
VTKKPTGIAGEFDPCKGHFADRETCRGEAFGAESWQKVRNICPNASPLPIVPPIAKILPTQNPAIRQP